MTVATIATHGNMSPTEALGALRGLEGFGFAKEVLREGQESMWEAVEARPEEN